MQPVSNEAGERIRTDIIRQLPGGAIYMTSQRSLLSTVALDGELRSTWSNAVSDSCGCATRGGGSTVAQPPCQRVRQPTLRPKHRQNLTPVSWHGRRRYTAVLWLWSGWGTNGAI
jgi:hypothetical protein